jgi:hypothetical protein
MPGGRGGRRKGTPGKGYSNRTDLSMDYAPRTTPTQQTAPQGNPSPPSGVPLGGASIRYPEDVPKLDDPTGRPLEPLTAGLDIGKGPGTEALGFVPPNPVVQTLQAAYLVNPTPQLRRVIARLSAKGII